MLENVRPIKGCAWGGVHEENIPSIVAKLVRSMYEGPRPIRSITIKIEVEDPSCEDYTHFWIEILDVEEPDEEGELQPDGGLTAEELLRELERAVEAELAEARDRLAELQERAIPGSIRSKMVPCGKSDCGKCPHGPYYYLKRPDGSEEYLGREVPPEIEDGVEAYHQAKELGRLLRRAEKLWNRSREELTELLSIMNVMRGDGYEE